MSIKNITDRERELAEQVARRDEEIVILCNARDREREGYWAGHKKLTAERDALQPDADAWRAYKARKDAVIAAGMGRNIMRKGAASMTDTRATFEAWWNKEHSMPCNDAYGYVRDAWKTWQASRQQALEEAAQVCETQIDPTRPATTSGYGYWHAEAIKELMK